MKRLLIFGAALLLSVSAAKAESDRIALLIGNGAYEHAPDAETAVIDVRSVGRALEAAGWEVTIGTDLDREEMQDALQELADQSGDARDLLIYYAGHALRSAERTYLAPVDQKADSAVDVEFGAVPLSLVLRILEGAGNQGVLLLDVAQVEGFRPQSFAEPGLGKIDAPKGVAVISAAPPGQAVRRTRGLESRFARLLADDLLRPDARLMATARELGAPLWTAGSASDDFALAAGATSEQPKSKPDTDTGGTDTGGDELAREIELAYWRTAERTGRAENYRAYLDRYPSGRFAAVARERLELAQEGALATPERTKPDFLDEHAMELSRARIRQVQSWLAALGHEPGTVDGLMGRNTRAAIERWERANNRPVNGYISRSDLDLLQQQGETALADETRRETEKRRVVEAEDRGYWAATGAKDTVEGYRDYLARYPDGLQAEKARENLAKLANSDSDRALRRERRDYEDARRADTPRAWRDFLADHPNGAFRDEAQTRLDQLDGTEKRAAEQERAERAEQALGLNARDRLSVEQRLRSAGFNPGPLDGRFDGETRRAISRYQADRGLPETGYLDRTTLVGLVQETGELDSKGPGELVIDGTEVIRNLLDAFGAAIRER